MQIEVRHSSSIGAEMRLFVLQPTTQAPLPAYTAGSHIDVTTPSGLVRQYSLCGDPSDRARFSILVKKDPCSRGGSLSMHQVSVGDVLDIGEPRNAFGLKDDHGPHLLISGGVGITPLLAMAHELTRRGDPFMLHHFGRREDLSDLRAELGVECFGQNFAVQLDVSRNSVPGVLDQVFLASSTAKHIYTCGPSPFMAAVEAAARHHLPSAAVYTEKFQGAAWTSNPLGDFQLTLARTGLTINVRSDQTLIQALESKGVLLPTGCLEGVCGACVTKFLNGEVVHLDDVLTDEERNEQHLMCPCVSRAKGHLTLDL
ncbi:MULTISPECIES: PDR/VanB family oxidoreductase [Paraburkholderia]|nr:PDR/VanB family oxidoreductase [Paraburkholderia podalyriae]